MNQKTVSSRSEKAFSTPTRLPSRSKTVRTFSYGLETNSMSIPKKLTEKDIKGCEIILPPFSPGDTFEEEKGGHIHNNSKHEVGISKMPFTPRMAYNVFDKQKSKYGLSSGKTPQKNQNKGNSNKNKRRKPSFSQTLPSSGLPSN
eukprot:TRINITY_DN652_c0_g1_i1.p1 TRINITY_DN652_c0_g1~~TRINITY_DN652_c0_g1_i1.p1  ORF type:complete len:145 (-),score=30.88 TRINITY_DN652_c0_g1_i1:81-515(-)